MLPPARPSRFRQATDEEEAKKDVVVRAVALWHWICNKARALWKFLHVHVVAAAAAAAPSWLQQGRSIVLGRDGEVTKDHARDGAWVGRPLHRLLQASRAALVRYRRAALASLLCLLLVLGTAAPFGGLQQGIPLPGLPTVERLSRAELVRIKALDEARSGVVHVAAEADGRVWSGGQGPMMPSPGGTGWLFDDAGHVVTSLSAVDSARHGSLRVRFADHTIAPARVVGVDRASNLAVVEVQVAARRPATAAGPLSPRPLRRGSSASLRVGQDVYVVGNPFGLDHTLSGGLVSALGRTLVLEGELPVFGALETDARVHAGNVGGPLLDSRGRVVAMATCASAPSSRFAPNNFGGASPGLALPVDAVARSVADILTHGHVERPSLGLGLGPDSLAQQLGCPGGGVVVVEVRGGGPADAAGVRVGDVVLTVGGCPVQRGQDVAAALAGRKPGETVRLTVRRPVDLAAGAALLPGRYRGEADVLVRLGESEAVPLS